MTQRAGRPRRHTHAPVTIPPASYAPESRSPSPTRRVNITLPEVQHDQLLDQGVNVSGVIRQLLEDYLSGSAIMLRVDPTTKKLYDEVVRSTGFGDEEIARELSGVLERLLERKLHDLAALKKQLKER